MKRKWLISFLITQLGCFSVMAQDTARITLQEVVQEALQHNRQLAISKFDEKLGQSAYRSTSAYFLPQINVSYSALTTNNPLNAFGFKLQQQVITQDDFNPKLLNEPSATSDFMAQVQVQQPLLNMDMLYMRKSVLKQAEAASFKASRVKQYIEFQVKSNWLQLQLLYATKKVLDSSLISFRELYRFTKDRYDQGLVQKSDLLNTEVLVRAAETRIAETGSAIRNTSDKLSLLMGKATGQVYAIRASVNETGQPNNTISNERSDFKAMESAIGALGYTIKSNQASLLPRINAFGNYQLHDKNAFGFGGNGYLAGIQLSWDLFKGNSVRNKIASLEIEKSKLNEELLQQKDESRSDILTAWRQYQDAGFTISQQTLAVSAAEESFRVLQNRYNQGLVNATDVLMAQTQVSNQQLALAQAVFSRQMAAAWLEFLTHSN